MAAPTMRSMTMWPTSIALAAMATLACCGAHAEDKTAERNARRMQLQMQNLQQQAQEAAAAKAKAEADKADAEKKLAAQAQTLPKVQGALRKTSDSLRASEAARAELGTRVAALEKQLAEQKRAGDDALAAKDAELARIAKFRDAQQAQLMARDADRAKQLGECSDKNDRLVKLSAELLDKYRHKSVADALKQRDPVLGLSDVQMFNLVQDYRDKADAERFRPSAPQ